MKLTDAMLKAIMPYTSAKRRTLFLPYLNHSASAYDISNELRITAWLATLAQESGELRWMQELASGAAYEGRADLGNTQKGDGRRFKGHGGIQVTGRTNHAAYTEYLRKNKHLPFVDFVKEPHRLAELPYAIDSAAWFFSVYIKANPLADGKEFLEIQLRVNGGRKRNPPRPNHWAERKMYYERALRVIPDNFILDDELIELTVDSRPVEDDVYPDYTNAETKPIKEDIKDEKPEGDGQVGDKPENGLEGQDTLGKTVIHIENQPNKDSESQKPTPNEPMLVHVTKEKPGLFTKVVTAIMGAIATALASITATCGGNEVATIIVQKSGERIVENAERSDIVTFAFVLLYTALGLGASMLLFWLAAKFYDKSRQQSTDVNIAKIDAAKDTQANTVEFKK